MLHKLKQWLNKNKVEIITVVILFLLAFLPRIVNLSGSSVTGDEVRWQQRADLLIKALSPFNLKLLQKSWDNFNNTIAIGLPTSALIAISKVLFSRWASPTFFSRLPFTIIGSLTAVFFYLLLKRINQPQIGIIGAVFLAIEPNFVAASRWAHRDVLLAFFCFVSIGLFYLGEKEDKFYLKIFSMIFCALAFLAKISAINILFIIIIWKIISGLRDEYAQKNLNALKAMAYKFKRKELLLPAIFLLVIFILWPALWGNPFNFLNSYFTGQYKLMSFSDSPILFMGKVSSLSPFYYYPIIIFIRLSPVILLTTVFGIVIFFIKDKNKPISDYFSLSLIWVLLFLLIIGLSSKKYEVRYTFPIWPAIAFLSAYGIYNAFSFIKRLNKNQIVAAGSTLIMLFELPVLLIYSPHNYMYYNSLVGGPKNVIKTRLSLVGDGEAPKYLVSHAKKLHLPKYPKILIYGHKLAFLYYMPERLKKNCDFSRGKVVFENGETLEGFYREIINNDNYDLIIIEDSATQLGSGPKNKLIMESGKYKIVYTYRFLNIDLGRIYMRKGSRLR